MKLLSNFRSGKSSQERLIVERFFSRPTFKFQHANTRINEFMNAKFERDFKKDGKVVDADEMLRRKLKSYTLSTKRK